MTELIWEGKYKDGKKVTPVRIALPFQTIETVNESAQQRQKTLDFFAAEPTADFNNKEWRNRLIWGDKKYVLPSLLPEFAGKVNLIYIDPPFNVGSDFSFTATIADHPDTEEDETTQFIKQPSIIEQKAYRDTWGKGLDSYMQWFYETSLLLRELLANEGSIYVHLDWHVIHYAKVILDEVFGYENFRSEIIWKRKTGRGQTNNISTEFGTQTDSILFYTASDKNVFYNPLKPLRPEYIEQFYKFYDENGRRYRLADLSSPSPRPNLKYEYKGFKPPEKGWAISLEKMKQWEKEGRIAFPKDKNGRIQRKRFLDENDGEFVQNLWDDVPIVPPMSQERLGYDTQKPEALLERIIKASSNEDDLVLDCFCGSGTTAATSEKLNRRWITCDLGRFAIHTARKRFLGISNVKPFIVQNLGKYERQQWMNAEFESPEDRFEQEKTYRHFILELYHAKSLDGYTWLHGAKAGKMIHVGGVETPVTVDDIKATIKEFWKLVGKEKSAEKNHIDFLGWDFAFDVNETAKQFAAENNVQIHPIKIPREVLEKKAVDQGDIKFYELASLGIKTKTNKLAVSVTLDNFTIPPDDVPEDVQGKITHWSQWIDYWAIDWNYRDDTFHNEWQSYRTKQNPKIELMAGYAYEKKGKYTVLVKVIDILGNDTTKAIEITV
jgi:adenine-specific DNA-methyltransferase